MTEVVADAGGNAWRQFDVDVRLRNRLSGSYGIYVDNVRSMKVALYAMMEKLALDPETGKPQFQDVSLFKQEYRRLKFSIKGNEYAEHVKQLQDHNRALITLTKQSLKLESTRMNPGIWSCPNFGALQSYARNLYEALKSALQCVGGCRGHSVKLRLEHRSTNEHDEDLTRNSPFHLVFSDDSAAKWQSAEIRYMLDSLKRVASGANTGQSTPASKRVRFSDPQDDAHQSWSTHRTTDVHSSISFVLNPTVEQIQSLCKAAASIQQSQTDTCIGYLLDSRKQKHGLYLKASSECGLHQQWSAYSLRQVLNKEVRIGRGLTRRDKLQMAVAISSSILQLYKTPWLEDDWSEDDVMFVYKPNDRSIYEYPYIHRRLSQTTNGTQQTQPPKYLVIRNQTLFNLGVLLIEIWYGKPIKELEIDSDRSCLGMPNVTWCTAARLVEEELEFEAGQNYSDAVRRCIRCDFNRSDTSLENEDFQRAVFKEVIVPLSVTLQQFKGKG